MHPKYTGWFYPVLVVALLMTIMLLAAPAFADDTKASTGQVDNVICLACHSNIDSAKFSQSVHGSQSCTNCHLERVTIPHKAGKSTRVDMQVNTCLKCHSGEVAESYKESFHGRAVFLGSTKTATCADCHGNHYILRSDNPASTVSQNNTPGTCAQCHQEPQANLAGKEHFVLAAKGPGMPMYYTYKFFTWLTIITVVMLLIHIELELFRQLRES